ncbi:MAG: helix-turn-helix transcriptional regulator [Alphaproteobacteria bacterium]|nr:helix-turn-helix transcriptional regulator [Alphaproteobacteria bacterium]
MVDSKIKPPVPVKVPGRRGRKPMNTNNANQIDGHVGARLRLRRTMMGISQEALAEKLGVTFQQVQKYEKGTNRIGSSRLFELSSILDIPVGFFFDDLDSSYATPEARVQHVNDPPTQYDGRISSHREALELMNSFSQIEAPKVRKKILELTRSLASLYSEENPEEETSEEA